MKIDDNIENFRFDPDTGEISAWIDPTMPNLNTPELSSLGARHVTTAITKPGDYADVTELIKNGDRKALETSWEKAGLKLIVQGEEVFLVKPNSKGVIPENINPI